MTTHLGSVHIADPDTGLVWDSTSPNRPSHHPCNRAVEGSAARCSSRRVRVGPVHAATPHASVGTKHPPLEGTVT